MENREGEAAIDGLEDDALELSLGLRPAPVRFPNLKIPAEKQPEIALCDGSGDLSLKSESEKEAQAARRREAMRKRKSKANAMNEASSERRRKLNGAESAVFATASFLPRGEKKDIQPVTGGDVEKNSGAGGNFSRGSSPGGSDYQSTSGQGGSSSDGGSHSSRSHPPDHAATNGPSPRNTEPCQTLKKAPIPGDLGLKLGKKPMNNNAGQAAKGSPDPSRGQGGEALLLSQMPCVSTTGNGPNGRTITGFLYRYTKSEVSIVCVCHGTAFSPAGFVEHAGGVDVENPLRRITVVPFALG